MGLHACKLFKRFIIDIAAEEIHIMQEVGGMREEARAHTTCVISLAQKRAQVPFGAGPRPGQGGGGGVDSGAGPGACTASTLINCIKDSLHMHSCHPSLA